MNIKRQLLKLNNGVDARLPPEMNIERLIGGKAADAKVCV